MNATSSTTQPADLFLDRLLELHGTDTKGTFERSVLMYLLDHGEDGVARLAIAAGLRRAQARAAAGHCVHCGVLPGTRHRWACPELLAQQSETSRSHIIDPADPIPPIVPAQRITDSLAAQRAAAEVAARREQLRRERPWWKRVLSW